MAHSPQYAEEMNAFYDRTGSSYSATRRPDPRIANRIMEALGDSASVVNVGAGAGSYEPSDRLVIAVEPSSTMISQRAAGSAPVVQGIAEQLPFEDDAFDATLAILTVHHWTDPGWGLAEMRRVAKKRVVVLTWDQVIWESFWLIREYLPCICDLDRRKALAIGDIVSALGECEVVTVPIPHDCMDGFHGAYWRRPEAYLDPRIRSGISTYASIHQDELDHGLRRLASDIQNGTWEKRHRELCDADEIDLGYRLVIARMDHGG